jgi:hypothetical protein
LPRDNAPASIAPPAFCFLLPDRKSKSAFVLGSAFRPSKTLAMRVRRELCWDVANRTHPGPVNRGAARPNRSGERWSVGAGQPCFFCRIPSQSSEAFDPSIRTFGELFGVAQRSHAPGIRDADAGFCQPTRPRPGQQTPGQMLGMGFARGIGCLLRTI